MNKYFLILLAAFFVSTAAYSQKYMTRSGHVWFFSEAPLENIEAHNYQVTSIIDMESGEMVFSMLMRGFEFEKALMQEHFNEKYVESDKYPKSTFQGSITDLSSVNLEEEGVYDVEVEGELTIHGVTREVRTNGSLEVKEGKFLGKSTFPVELAEYDIRIPSVVKDNIAKIVEVTVEMSYEPYNK